MSPTADRPIFHVAGDRYVASDLARGPWDPGACHGGAPAALLAAAVDGLHAPAAMQGVRLTFDLLRPVPVGVPLTLDAQVVREGRRVQVVDARLSVADGGPELVRCRALRLRRADLDLPADRPTTQAALTPPPESLPRLAGVPGITGEGFWTAVDVRLVEGRPGRPGVGRGWFRLLAPLTDGQQDTAGAVSDGRAVASGPVTGALALTPLARVAATGDFGNGIGAPLPMGAFRYLNPDLTVDIHRLPVDEWVSLTSSSVAQPAGVGLASGTLGDREGELGRCLQSLFIDTV